MKKTFLLALITFGLASIQAGDKLEITITNITKNQIFAPPVAISHNYAYHLFTLGEPSSMEVYTMAEDGDASGIYNAAMDDENVLSVAAADGPVMPGQSVTLEVDVDFRNTYLTVAGMLVDTNDGFFALDGHPIRISYYKGGTTAGKQGVMAYVYDAGSEANTESCDHIPGPPCGNGGVRVTDGAEGYVYPHPGIHGMGDLSVKDFGWSGPAAKITISKMD